MKKLALMFMLIALCISLCTSCALSGLLSRAKDTETEPTTEVYANPKENVSSTPKGKTTPETAHNATPETTPEATPVVKPTPPEATETPYVPQPGENAGPEYFVSQYHPIICGDILIGGSSNGKWLTAQEVAPKLNGTELYTLFNTTDAIGNGLGGTIPPYTDDYLGPYTEMIEDWRLDMVDGEKYSTVYNQMPIGVWGEGEEQFCIAVSNEWDVLPRAAQALALKNDTYEQVVKDILAENGLKVSKANIIQCMRVDFEGDGVDEVVIVAESPTTDWRYSTENGSYSLVVLRKIVDGKVQNFTLHVDIHTDVEGFYEENGWYNLRYIEQICGFYDLNGDGKLELVTVWSYYEGFYYYVYEIYSYGPVSVLVNGWGV